MYLLYTLIYLAIISIAVFSLGRFFPRKWINENAFPFICFSRERGGALYEKIKIRKWKTKWPDASMILHRFFPKRYPKKRLDGEPIIKLPVLIKESCIAELTHFLCCILGFSCVFIWKHIGGFILFILYLFVNIPPIIIQRYNRPRYKKLLLLEDKKLAQKANTHKCR